MADFGIKVSARGDDVKDANDEDLILTSKHPIFKVHQEGSGSLSLPGGDATADVNITHNLGAESIVLAYAQNEHGDSDRLFVPGRTVAVAGGSNEAFIYAAIEPNSWNFRVDRGGAPGSDEVYKYRYYVMSDQITF